MLVTKEDIAQTASALRNLDSYISGQIAKEARSEHERILMQSAFEGNMGGAYEKLRAYHGGVLTQRLKDQTVQLQKRVNADLEAAAAAHDRQQAVWQNAIRRDEYAFQQSRMSARIKEARTPQQVERLVRDATTREQLEALRDLMPDALARFNSSDIMERAALNSLSVNIDAKLNALRPSTLVESESRLQSTIDTAHAANAVLHHANQTSGGALNVELGLSPFSPAPEGDRGWEQQVYQHEGANLLG